MATRRRNAFIGGLYDRVSAHRGAGGAGAASGGAGVGHRQRALDAMRAQDAADAERRPVHRGGSGQLLVAHRARGGGAEGTGDPGPGGGGGGDTFAGDHESDPAVGRSIAGTQADAQAAENEGIGQADSEGGVNSWLNDKLGKYMKEMFVPAYAVPLADTMGRINDAMIEAGWSPLAGYDTFGEQAAGLAGHDAERGGPGFTEPPGEREVDGASPDPQEEEDDDEVNRNIRRGLAWYRGLVGQWAPGQEPV